MDQILEMDENLGIDLKVKMDQILEMDDILELDHLSVSGDVTFGKQVCFKMFRIASAAPDLISLNYR